MNFKNIITLTLFLVVCIPGQSQSVEAGICFNSGNAEFYKNAFGLSLNYNYPVKKSYLFAGVQGSYKNSSYAMIAKDLTDGSGYIMKQADGEMFHFMTRFGIARRIIDKEATGVSFGLYASYNFIRIDDQTHYFSFDTPGNNYNDFKETIRSDRNTYGGGCFLDFELKNVISKNLSLFSRTGFDIIRYDGNLEGDPFFTPVLLNFGFSAGLRMSMHK